MDIPLTCNLSVKVNLCNYKYFFYSEESLNYFAVTKNKSEDQASLTHISSVQYHTYHSSQLNAE